MPLDKYRKMRDPERTPEPFGGGENSAAVYSKSGGMFCIQKHAATRLHYDFRLAMEGVLRSWAVPKGPSLDPKEKRLAVHVEDHPIDYGDVEGVIPDDNYGAAVCSRRVLPPRCEHLSFGDIGRLLASLMRRGCFFPSISYGGEQPANSQRSTDCL